MIHDVMSRRQVLAEAFALVAVAQLAPKLSRRPTPARSGEMHITVQGLDAGLASIKDVRISNGTVQIAEFSPGTTAPVRVTATKADAGKPTSWSFVTVDMNGKTRRWS